MLRSLLCSLIFIFVLSLSFVYGVKPYNEKSSDFTATMKWSIEFVTNYIPPWYFPNEVKKPMTGIKYHYTLYYDKNNKRPFGGLGWYWKGVEMAKDFIYVRGMCSNNNVFLLGGAHESFNEAVGMVTGGLGVRGSMRPDGTKIPVTRRVFEVPGGKMVVDESEKYPPPGSRIDVIIITKGELTMPGVLEVEGRRIRARWVFEYDEPPPDFDYGMRGKKFTVIGPVVKPLPSKGPLGYIEKLIEITTQAFNMGWISKYDVYQGLMDKLEGARENIRKGRWHYHTAINIMGAFKNLLEAQRGKGIEEQCYRMLYYDADELIRMLR